MKSLFVLLFCLAIMQSNMQASESVSHRDYENLIDSIYRHANIDQAKNYYSNATIQWNYNQTEAAILRYQQSCKLGLAIACETLAEIYAEGLKGVTKDKEKAQTYYILACALGDSQSCDK